MDELAAEHVLGRQATARLVATKARYGASEPGVPAGIIDRLGTLAGSRPERI